MTSNKYRVRQDVTKSPSFQAKSETLNLLPLETKYIECLSNFKIYLAANNVKCDAYRYTEDR